ncbi:MAG: hypothetical protein AAB969_00630 [Patescibacteria group bacterium]
MCLGKDEEIIRKETEEIAERLYKWMLELKPPEGQDFAVHPREFLPADVCCDFVGKARFIRGMGRIIAVALTEHNKKRVQQ